MGLATEALNNEPPGWLTSHLLRHRMPKVCFEVWWLVC